LRWVALAGLVGFATAAIFSSWLYWSRGAFVGACVIVTPLFATVYVVKTGLRPLTQLRRRWVAGLVVGLWASPSSAVRDSSGR
jgi:hypothetical protein